MSTVSQSFLRTILGATGLLLSLLLHAAPQPVDAPLLPLAEVKAGMKGEVWTVFRGTQPEPFSAEVTGVVRTPSAPARP